MDLIAPPPARNNSCGAARARREEQWNLHSGNDSLRRTAITHLGQNTKALSMLVGNQVGVGLTWSTHWLLLYSQLREQIYDVRMAVIFLRLCPRLGWAAPPFRMCG